MTEHAKPYSDLIPERCPLCSQDDCTLTGERPNGPHIGECEPESIANRFTEKEGE